MATVTLTNDDVQAINEEAIEPGIPAVLALEAFATKLNAEGAIEDDIEKVAVYGSAPDATAWNVSSNNYETGGSNTVTYVDVTLDQRKKTTWTTTDQKLNGKRIDPVKLARTNINGLIKQMVEDVMSLIVAATYTNTALTSTAANFDSDDIATLWDSAEDANFDEETRKLILTTAYMTNLLKDNDLKNWQNSNDDQILKQAKFPMINGFDIIHSKIVPGNSENLVGFITDTNGIAVATAMIPPAFEDEGVMFNPISIPGSDLVIGSRVHYSRATGIWNFNYESVYGYAAADATKITRIISS